MPRTVLAALATALASVYPLSPLQAQTGPALAQLPPVKVSATRFAESVDVLPFGVSVISAADIERAGVSTINEAIIKLLGVPGRLDFYGGGDYGLDLRGFGATAASNQVVIVDGIRINEADLGGTRLAGIDIDSVERIEVIRGSAAVLYGEGATGGAIIVTTKAGGSGSRQNAATAYAAAGSYGLRELRASGTLVNGGFSADVTANQRRADNHRDNFKSDTDGASLVAQWRGDGLRLGARFAVDKLDTGLPGSLSAEQYRLNPAQTTSPTKTGAIRNQRQILFAQGSLGDWQLALDAGKRRKELDSLNKGTPTYQYEVDANNVAARAKHQGTLGSATNALVLGIDQTDWTRTTLGTWGSVAKHKSHAVYVNDDLTLAGATRLAAGLRTESVEQSNSSSGVSRDTRQTAWELGVTQPLAKGWSAYARIGRSFRLANVDELGFTLPGALLLPQTSRDLELGTRWSYATGRAELRWYRSALRNEVGYDPVIANPNSWNGFGANVNFDPTQRQGMELQTDHALSSALTLQVNAALRQARFTDGAYSGRDVPLVPHQTVALRADWRPLPGHSVNGGVNWVASQSPDFNNACRMPSYVTSDVRYAYQFDRAELSLGINNLTDSKYYTLAYRCTAGVTQAIYPEAGRAVTASVRFKF
ncbi:TonB-dependent receptor [Rhodoferax sp.]|uniref:TonB-dependent receptor n=1 Tax=Rhodoferax sp. TaxID=50421 RepID=UPI0027780B41|nr:TonB-dependent receptor [Rhodoferax sp.]